MKLRPFQTDLVTLARAAFKSGSRFPLIQLPTGGGKTPTVADMVKKTITNGKRVLFMAHRDNLIIQASETFDKFGIEHGRIQPGQPETEHLCQIGSVATVVRRLDRVAKPDLIVIDEAHHCAGINQWTKIVKHFGCRVIGVTATPCRLDGKGLGVKSGGIFDKLIIGPSMRDLISDGYLVPLKLYGPARKIDTKDVKIQSGDYSRESLDSMVKPQIVGDAVQHWIKFAFEKRTLVFCHCVKVAEDVRDAFRAAGISADCITGKDSRHAQRSKINALARGQIKILTSVDVVSEGTDIPAVDCGILMRPTASLALFMQQCGRIMRLSDGKSFGLILDMVGNIARHGLPDEDRNWSLDPKENLNAKGNRKNGAPKLKQCEKCYQVFESGTICPHCGHIHDGRELEQTQGELEEIKANELIRKKNAVLDRKKAKTYADLYALQIKNGYKHGWSDYIFKSRTGRAPTMQEKQEAKKQGRLR